jgi:hypothetical protein
VRKRFVIGTIAAVVIGGAVFVYSQLMGLARPRKGTVSYHKIELLKHRWALLDAGYLSTNTFVVSNRPTADVWLEFGVGLAKVLDSVENALTHVSVAGTNGITVVAPKPAMDKIGAFFQQLDVPQKR